MAAQNRWILCVVALVVLLASVPAAASAWQPFHFTAGELYAYQFVWEHADGSSDQGEFIIITEDAGFGELQVSVEFLAAGEFHEVSVTHYGREAAAIFDDVFAQVRSTVPRELALPFILTLWEDWSFTPLDGLVFQEDMPLIRDEDLGITVEVAGMRSVAERSGYELDMMFSSQGVDLEHFSMVVDPQLALPLAISVTHLVDHLVLADSLLTVELVIYHAEAEPHAVWDADPTDTEAGAWWPMAFRDGQWYEYDLHMLHPDGTAVQGAFTLGAWDLGPRERLVWVELREDDQRYEAAAILEAGNLMYFFDDLHMAVMQAAPDQLAAAFVMMLWVPWFESSLNGIVLEEGMPPWEDAETELVGEVVGWAEQGGRSGYALEIHFLRDEELFATLHMMVDPALALPLYVALPEIPEAMSLGGAQVSVELAAYRSDAPPPSDLDAVLDMLYAPPAAGPETYEVAVNVIDQLLHHLESWGLVIEDLVDKDYRLLGATDGVAIGLAEGFFEVYHFDPRRTSADVQLRLEEARHTGVLTVPDMDMELLVMVHGELVVAALEVGGGWVHPAKEAIEQAILSFALNM